MCCKYRRSLNATGKVPVVTLILYRNGICSIDSMRSTSGAVCNSIPSQLLRSVRQRQMQPQNFCPFLPLFAVLQTGITMPAPGDGTIVKAFVMQRNPPREEGGYSGIPLPSSSARAALSRHLPAS